MLALRKQQASGDRARTLLAAATAGERSIRLSMPLAADSRFAALDLAATAAAGRLPHAAGAAASALGRWLVSCSRCRGAARVVALSMRAHGQKLAARLARMVVGDPGEGKGKERAARGTSEFELRGEGKGVQEKSDSQLLGRNGAESANS